MKIIRLEDNSLDIDWFRKPTWSGRYLNFMSSHPNCQKKSLIIGQMKRTLRLSKAKFHTENLTIIKKIFISNSYKESFVDSLLKKPLMNSNQSNGNTDTKNLRYISFPYIIGLSEYIKKILFVHNFQATFKTSNSLSFLFSKLKDRGPLLNQNNLVYKIDCLNCDGTYIGQTKQYLKSRIYEHEYSIERKIPNVQCWLANHSTNLKYNFDFSNPKILDKEHNLEKRLILEMIEILNNKNSSNKRSDMDCFSNIYKKFLEKNHFS